MKNKITIIVGIILIIIFLAKFSSNSFAIGGLGGVESSLMTLVEAIGIIIIIGLLLRMAK